MEREALNILFGGRPPLICKPQQIEYAVSVYETQRMKIIYETVDIVNTTLKADTFFSRYALLLEVLGECVKLERLGVKFKKFSATRNYNDITAQKQLTIKFFIDRSYADMMERASALKSEQARENRRQKYFDTLRKYECSMTEENIEYLYRLKDQISTNTASSEKYDRQQENTSYYVEYYSLDKENVSDDVKERYRTAVFLKWASRGYPIKHNDEYPKYFKRELNIDNPRAFHSLLAAKGYIQKLDNRSKLSKFKVSEIKELLVKYNLSETGKKQDLIERAVSQISDFDLSKELAHIKNLMLTESGWDFLSQNSGYDELYRHNSWITLPEYERMRNKGVADFLSAAEIILTEKDKTPNRDTKFILAEIYFKKDEKSKAINYYIETLYYDCCGMVLPELRDVIQETEKDIAPAPYVIEKIYELRNYYTTGLAENLYELNCATKCLCSRAKFAEIVDEIIRNGDFEI